MDEIKPRHLYTIISDDVREELGNKLSFIGVYDKSIFVPKLPARLAKLCFSHYWTGGQGKFKVVGKLVSPSGQVVADITIEEVRLDEKTSERHVLIFQFSGLVFNEPGKHRLQTYFGSSDIPDRVDEIEIKLSE